MTFDHPAWRKRPLTTALRLLASLVRQRVPSLSRPVTSLAPGRARVRADLSTALGLQLFRYGAEDLDLELIGALLRPGDLFVDGGANLGLFSLVAASAVGPTGAVVAFEPATETADRLEANLALNGYRWVQVQRVALADRPGERTFTVFGGNAAGLSSFAPQAQGGGEVRSVPVSTLDASLGPLAARVRLVKLDLEGAEQAALRGASGLLGYGPDLLVEVEDGHLRRQGSSRSELLGLLRDAGYQLFRVVAGARGGPALVELDSPRSSASPNVFATRSVARVRAAGIPLP